MCGEYTDYTRSHHHPGAQFWVGSSRNWSVFLERPNTGRHEKAPARCPCNRLAALHGAPRTRDCDSDSDCDSESDSDCDSNSDITVLYQKIIALCRQNRNRNRV